MDLLFKALQGDENQEFGSQARGVDFKKRSIYNNM
jgi:hypothetical protein